MAKPFHPNKEPDVTMAKASSFLKRGTPSCWPDELVVATDPEHPLYDDRLESLPVTDERIRNFAAVGQIQPIAVRVEGDDLIITAGRQRWKRATVINHVVGVRPYKGKVKPILEAIDRIKGTDLAAFLADTVPDGMKLQFAIYRSDKMSAGLASTSENEQRDQDPREARIRRVQRMAHQGHAPEDIADAMGWGAGASGIAKVKRLLKVDLEAPKPAPRPRSIAKRPSPKRLEEILARAVEDRELPQPVFIALGWASGKVLDAAFFEAFPSLAPAAKKAKAA